MVAKKKAPNEPFSLSGSLALILTSVVLFLSPYFRGLFFNQELYIAFLAIALAGVLLIYSKWSGLSKAEGLVHPVDYIGLVFVIAYCISMLGALDLKNAVLEFLKAAYFFTVYFLVSRQVRKLGDADRVLQVLYLSALGVALIGLSAAFGTINLAAAFDQDKRITSTIQYANSLAAYLIPAILLGFYLAVVKRSTHKRVVFGKSTEADLDVRDYVRKAAYSFGNYLLFLTFLGTLSRGGWLVFGAVVVVYLIGTPKEFRWQTLLHAAATIGTGFAVSGKALDFAAAIPGTSRWGWVALGGIVLAGIITGGSYLGQKLSLKSRQTGKIVGAVGVALIVILVLLNMTNVISLSKFAPARMAAKVQSINLKERNVQERFVYYQDAMKIVKQSPILGSGGGAWDAAYRKYRSYNYTTAEVHNQYLKVWLEAGLLGLVAFVLVFLLALYSVARGVFKAKSAEHRAVIWVCGMGVASLGIHSFIDFNLSLGAVSLVLWTLLGLITALERIEELPGRLSWELPSTVSIVLYWGTAVLMACMLILPIDLLISQSYSQTGYRELQNGDVDTGIQDMETANSLNPTADDSEANLAAAWLYLYQHDKAPDGLAKATQLINRALRMNSYDPDLYGLRSQIQAVQGKVSESVKDMETAQSYDPWEPKRYDDLGTAYLNAGKYLLSKGDKAGARQLFENLIGLDKVITAKMAGLSPEYKSLWTTGGYPKLEVSAKLQKKIKTAQELMAKL